MSNLNNKVAVVTGGSSGIGFATARRFIAEGAQVVITGRNQEALDSAVADLGERATGIQGDVANLDDLDRLFAQVQEQFGRVDLLFANAGIAPFVPFEVVTEEHFDRWGRGYGERVPNEEAASRASVRVAAIGGHSLA